MAAKRMNVLVFAGTGSGAESVRLCLLSLRSLLSPTYAVSTCNGETIIKEPWSASCALLVFPGGGDLGYCKVLNGEGNRIIRKFVSTGGSFMGFCAGGYYGSKRCEFEVGDKDMEVVGDRELGFYPGTCRGSAFKGFKYNSEAGTRAVELKIPSTPFGGSAVPKGFKTYFNGGSVFVDAEDMEDRGVHVLASYTQELAVDGGHGAAAVVYCKVGSGGAILTGPHPEFAGSNLSKDAKDMPPNVVETLTQNDALRIQFLRACLMKLGLQVNQEEHEIPSLSPLHLSSSNPVSTSNLLHSMRDIVESKSGLKYINGGKNVFQFHDAETWSVDGLDEAFKQASIETMADNTPSAKRDTADDTQKEAEPPLTLITHVKEMPGVHHTPSFRHHTFFSELLKQNSYHSISSAKFGHHLIYGSVVSSTNSLLEKNAGFTDRLPQGTTFTATTQLAGRGRGSNVWVSPPGTLLFSTIVRHPLTLNITAPIVFLQYIAALAVAKGTQSYRATAKVSSLDSLSPYENLPIRLKWPNDIYALDPNATAPIATPTKSQTPPSASAYTKIGGILVNSSYTNGDFTLIVGIGLNVANDAGPTTSINSMLHHLAPSAPPMELEPLLACILSSFESLYNLFCAKGWAGELEHLYYKYWLHDGQLVHVETEGNLRARIKGVTRDWGLLLVEEVEGEDDALKETGRMFALQTDSNSFDFFRGLLKRKV